jgi:hypothetical protein
MNERDDLTPGERAELAELAEGVANIAKPRDLSVAEHQNLVELALSRVDVRKARPRSGDRVVFLVFGFAAAALLALYVGTRTQGDATAPVAAFRPPPSILAAPTDGLVARATGGVAVTATARIDRIASTRARSLRENRFGAWGVR